MGNPADEDLNRREASGTSLPPAEAPPDYDVAVATGPSRLYRPFPPEMQARYQWKITATFHLCGGERPDDRLFAVSTHAGWDGEVPRIVLHNGPSDKDPVLAFSCEERTVTRLDVYSPNSIVKLPPVVPSADPKQLATEIMRAHTIGETGVGYEFSIEVSHSAKLVREKFEWRKVKKGADGELKEGGFKLLRLSSRRDPESVAASPSQEPAAATEDGYDVVAVFKWNKTLTNLMRPFDLRFVGDALSGSLGERWALVTVLTALRLWFLHAGARANRKTVAAGEGVDYQAP
ncbi:hypothetical protein GGS23DRAFT_275794 [Durotheca rogersii]|uniref:uncharacterized protein n=1 Tax=Durotheca rogersii TaxID=419775 RepID=UPI00221E90C8|nr:uncharacterized protein GGS23DRAFT_275794 [Durotheca rogersii]KAI5866532.1 hypothetical protein GGS23DRAFT_275794 [Durotheca rogersii]